MKDLVSISTWEDGTSRLLSSSGMPWSVRAFEEVPSTMDLARDLIGESSQTGGRGVVMARRQTHGRGRQGRSWISDEGGFYATWLFRAGRDVAKLAGLSLAVGVAVVKGLGLPRSSCGLKWPNDLFTVDGRKWGGVLIETVTFEGETWVLVGTGLNLSGAPIPESASLAEIVGEQLEPIAVGGLLGPVLHRYVDVCVRGGFSAVREEWLSWALYLGCEIGIDLGNEIARGSFVDVTMSGSIVIQAHGRRREIAAGHVVAISK